MTARSALLVLIMALAITACGRKGPLEPPPGPARPAQTGQAQPAGPLDRGGTAAPADDGAAKPDRPFILDAIL